MAIIGRMDEEAPIRPPKPKSPDGVWFPALALSVVVAALQMLLASPAMGISPSLASVECVAVLAYACMLGYANQRVYGTAALVAAPWLLFVLGTLLATAETMTSPNDFFPVAIMAFPLLVASTNFRESALGGSFFAALSIVSVVAVVALFILFSEFTTRLLLNILYHVLLPLPIGLACGYLLRRNVGKPDPPLQSPPVERL